MRCARSYQDIKTEEDYEYDRAVDAAFEELLDQYADEIEEQGMNRMQKASLMQRARKIARDRITKVEEPEVVK